MLPSKSISHVSSHCMSYGICIFYHSRYNASNRTYLAPKKKKRFRDPQDIEDPVSSMDDGFLDPQVKKWKHWRWNWNALSSNQYSKLKGMRETKRRMYEKEDELPYWYDIENPKKMNVIFIRDMDEFLAGQITSIETGLYRNWLWPQKIALPASVENVQRYIIYI